MPTVNIPEAKSSLSWLVDRIERGMEREIIIARNGRPAARLVPVRSVADAGKRVGSPEHAAAVERLPQIRNDPFDRLLVAQSITEPLRLMTHDATLSRYSDTVIAI